MIIKSVNIIACDEEISTFSDFRPRQTQKILMI